MIRQMHVLQIDTIHVVARSPYLVLWSRLGDYAQPWLDELLAEGALFEGNCVMASDKTKIINIDEVLASSPAKPCSGQEKETEAPESE